METAPGEKQVQLEQVRLNYWDGGEGPPLVLIPGQSMPWQSYQKVLPALSRRFHVYALDIRGHGRSEWTTGRYTFSAVGKDLAQFLEQVVKAPAIVSGNSSGGVLAVWLAATVPQWVRAILPEDPPLFLSEWPRLKETFAHTIFLRAAQTLMGPNGRDVGAFFTGFEVPLEGRSRVMKFPKFLAGWVASAARRAQRDDPTAPVDLWWAPFPVRMFVRGLSQYDPDFSRAFTDGSACDIDHAQLLSKVRCPMWLVHANWFEHPTLGTVGAMNGAEAARAHSLVPGSRLLSMQSGHVVHQESPAKFVRLVEEFAASLTPLQPGPPQ